MKGLPHLVKPLFIEFQLMHYSQRLLEAKTEAERKFVQRELANLETANLKYYRNE